MIDPDTLERILADMRNTRDVDRAVEAAEEFRRLATPDDAPRLRQLLGCEGYFVRECLGDLLAWLEGATALPLVLRVLREGDEQGHDHDGLVSGICDWVEAHPAEAAPHIRTLLAGSNPQDRTDGAWLAGFAASHVEFPSVLAASHDPDAGVRSAAVGSLTAYRAEAGVFDRLMAALDDPSDQVVGDAISSLGYLGDRRALPRLEQYARDATSRHRSTAAYAVKQLRKAT